MGAVTLASTVVGGGALSVDVWWMFGGGMEKKPPHREGAGAVSLSSSLGSSVGRRTRANKAEYEGQTEQQDGLRPERGQGGARARVRSRDPRHERKAEAGFASGQVEFSHRVTRRLPITT